MKKMRSAFIGCLFLALCGCLAQDPAARAQHYAREAQERYTAAARLYERMLADAPDSSRLRFAAGMLYFSHGDLDRAISHLRRSAEPNAAKYQAIALYRSGDHTAALEICSRQDRKDDEFQYYHGLICEKLNLFDRALAAYRGIRGKAFAGKAAERIAVIEKAVNTRRIGDIDPGVAAILAGSPEPGQYPQAGALILLSDEKAQITADNTMVYRLHYIVRIVNERGKERFAEAPIEYDSTDEKVVLEYARTIRPDGTVVDVGSRHIRDVSKYLNFPLYSNARVFIISFPEITEGAVIEYKVAVHRSQLINKKDFVIPLTLQTFEPVIDSRFELEIPASRKVNIRTINERYNSFNAVLSPAVARDNGRITYRWQCRNIPQIIPEPQMPPVEEINPAVLISSFDSWQALYEWWWLLAKDKVKATAAIRQKVGELTGGIVSAEARIAAIHHFCAQKIRYVAVEYGQAGYEPHHAGDIFQNKYGDCKDQAILLVTMLREAGFDAWPVLIPTSESFAMDRDFPAMLFNHCIAAVSWNGKLVFMDPTAETCSFGDLPAGDQDRTVLIIKENGYEIARTPLYPAGHNTVSQRLSLAIGPDEGIAGTRAVSSSGIYDQAQRYWLLYTLPDTVRDTITSKIQEISVGARLDAYFVDNLNDLNRPLVLRYTFTGPDFMIPAGRLRILPSLAGIDMSSAAKESRVYPILYPVLDAKNIETAISLPPGYTARYVPEPIEEENKWMKFSARYDLEAQTLLFRQSVELRVRIVTREEYPTFKEFMEQLGLRLKQRVVLERKK